MPASRPSEASLKNSLSAAKATGLTPTALYVAPDGSYRLDFDIENCSVSEFESGNSLEKRKLPTFEDVS